jgi:hypothetical protein
MMAKQFSELETLRELLRVLNGFVARTRLVPIRLAVLDALEDARHGQRNGPPQKRAEDGGRPNDEALRSAMRRKSILVALSCTSRCFARF